VLKAQKLANSATIVMAVTYIVCWFVSVFAQDILFSLSASWIHSLSLEGLKADTSLSIDQGILGLISWSAFVWITVYSTAWLYNHAGK
jgi:hypothetical protein